MGKLKEPPVFSLQQYREFHDFLLAPVLKHRDPRAASRNMRAYPDARRVGRSVTAKIEPQ